MTQVIIYPNNEGWLTVVSPAPECGLSIEEIARKDVPAGKPYHIINVDQLPQDSMFFNAWEADFTNAVGRGIGADAWFAEQAAKKEKEQA
jgi:hypothetical protein